jgi:hypothetical protein
MGKSTNTFRDRMAVRDMLLLELADAAAHRDERIEILKTAYGPVCEWVVYEWWRMLAAVNTERTIRGLAPVGIGSVQRAERLASGHVDYATKYALYCAELVVEPPRRT